MSHYQSNNGVAVITLDHPPVNALALALRRKLGNALLAALDDPAVHAMVITGTDRGFSAGGDITEFDLPAVSQEPTLFTLFSRIETSPKPVVAALRGMAMGGGLELAMACHARVAHSNTQVGLPEIHLGLLPGAGGTQRLTLLCGAGVAARVILAGDLLDGGEAHRVGLAQYAVDAAELPARVDALVAQIAAMSPDSLRACKACIRIAGGMAPEGAKAEIDGLAHLLTTGEARRRVASFLSR